MKFLPILFASAVGAFAADDQGSFVSLFNGRDLSGWINVNCAPETWGVKDGMITCTGKPTGALRSQRQYENFIFEVEWRHLTSGGNAGIFVWAGPIAAPGVPFLRAIEVQVLDHGYGNTANYTTHGDVFPIHGSTMAPIGRNRGMRSFPSEERSKPSPEWNQYRIVANDGVLRLSVNGKEVSGGDKCVWRKGYLALESEGAPTEWRNLRIKELPSTGATPEQSAPEAQGHQPLYTGLDLRGWKTGAPDRWQPNDWRLTLAAGTAGEPLWTEREFGDVEFIADIKVGAKSNTAPAILVRGKDNAQTRIVLSELLPTASSPIAGVNPSNWNRIAVIIQDDAAIVTINETEVRRLQLGPDVPKRGAIGLVDVGGPVEFANFYVREL
jgi:hypothetical protein